MLAGGAERNHGVDRLEYLEHHGVCESVVYAADYLEKLRKNGSRERAVLLGLASLNSAGHSTASDPWLLELFFFARLRGPSCVGVAGDVVATRSRLPLGMRQTQWLCK